MSFDPGDFPRLSGPIGDLSIGSEVATNNDRYLPYLDSRVLFDVSETPRGSMVHS